MKPSKSAEYPETLLLLERAAKTPSDLSDAETIHLMKFVLHLPLSYFLAVGAVIRQSRWRASRNPIAYVRKSAQREALKDPELQEPKGLPVPREIDGAPMNHDKYIDFCTACESGPVKIRGVWHDWSYRDEPDDYDEDGNHITLGERLQNKVRAEFTAEFPTPADRTELEAQGISLPVDAERCIDWEKVAEAAGLDTGEAEVLAMMAMGIGRDQAMKFFSDGDKDRRRIQAAWRRFGRNRCLERVAAELKCPQYGHFPEPLTDES